MPTPEITSTKESKPKPKSAKVSSLSSKINCHDTFHHIIDNCEGCRKMAHLYKEDLEF
jgi:hypothetical protein